MKTKLTAYYLFVGNGALLAFLFELTARFLFYPKLFTRIVLILVFFANGICLLQYYDTLKRGTKPAPRSKREKVRLGIGMTGILLIPLLIRLYLPPLLFQAAISGICAALFPILPVRRIQKIIKSKEDKL